MTQAIPVFIINLDRRTDRLDRIGAHLALRGVTFGRVAACDAETAGEEAIGRVIAPTGPLGALGKGDRACTVSHTLAWQQFLDGGASHGLFLEDDIFLAEDIARVLAGTGWIPEGAGIVKLEKFGEGASRLLLGPRIGQTPTGRAIHRMHSRHVGGGAYILSRAAAQAALGLRGALRVPVDHALFNDTVSGFARRMKPAIVVPAMATQRAYDYNSDIARFGKAARPTGWRLSWRKLKRGAYEVNQLPRQLLQLATGRARLTDVAFSETPPPSSP